MERQQYWINGVRFSWLRGVLPEHDRLLLVLALQNRTCRILEVPSLRLLREIKYDTPQNYGVLSPNGSLSLIVRFFFFFFLDLMPHR